MGAPDLPILIYDGSCGLCANAANWLKSRALAGAMLVRPSQELNDLKLESLDIARADVMRSVWWVHGPLRLDGDQAIAAALRSCRGPWRLAGVLIASVPIRWVAPLAYKVVARHRHRLPGGRSTCAAPH